MKPLLAIAVSLLVVQAARGESFTVRIQETAIVEIAGATAAYTTNPIIADAALAGAGRVAVIGHSSGTTQLMVVTASGMQAFGITVAAAPQAPSAAPAAGEPLATYDGRYSSGSERLQSGFDLLMGPGERRSELFVLHIRDLSSVPGQSPDTIASMFYRYTTPDRVLTLLDELVDVSRLTVSNTQVRGLHLRQGALEVHGGYASTTMYDDFFLPTQRRWVGGAGYGIHFGSTRWTPSVYGFFSEPDQSAARRGVVGAISVEHREGDTFFVRGDVGVSGSVAAAGELRYSSPRTQLRVFLSLKPDDFPTLGLSDVPGSHIEVDGSGRATDRLTITSSGTVDQLTLAAGRQTIGAASLGLRYDLTQRLAVAAGADVSDVRTPMTSIRTIGLPLSVSYEMPTFGLAASYRLLDNSETSRRGDTLRLSAHTGTGPFSASVFAERQRQAPTLDLIFREEPGLELALLRLGISVSNPEDVARALRDNAALIDLGFITGVNVRLEPRRLRAGFNLGWLGSGPRSDHFRLVAIYGRDDGISTSRTSMIATLTYSRRVLTATDLYGSYTLWQAGLTTQQETGSSVEIGLRQRFTPGLPQFLRRSGTIEGFVFVDPEMLGLRSQSTMPLPGIEVTLDDTLKTRTDDKGAYAFHQVPPGAHRIAAHLPISPHAFFTTPSSSETDVPAHVDFGLVWADARIDGRVVSDAGEGIPGAVLSAAGKTGVPISTTSDSVGRFGLAVPPGTFHVVLARESLPIGYVIAGEGEQIVSASPDQPRSLSFEVRALRSVGGRAAGASEVRIESLGRTAVVDAEGNFVFRSMPPGTFTLTARSGGGTISRSVTVPGEPAIVRDVILGAAPPAVASAGSPPAPPIADRNEAATPRRRAPLDQHGVAFHVAAGAFRLPENAAAVRQRIERLGGHAEVTRRGSLELVTVGPFASREAAEAEEARLNAAGIDVALVAVRATPAPPLSDGQHVVQTGAFREERNARQLLEQLRLRGEQPLTVTKRDLTFVYIGPFETRQDAVEASVRLQRSGFDGFVTRR